MVVVVPGRCRLDGADKISRLMKALGGELQQWSVSPAPAPGGREDHQSGKLPHGVAQQIESRADCQDVGQSLVVQAIARCAVARRDCFAPRSHRG